MRNQPITSKMHHLVLFLVPLLVACHADPDVAVIDFSQTIPVERPADPPLNDSRLRVAVAAMISPRETVNHYHHLLNHIGARMGRSIEFVQRKTYGEISGLLGTGRIDLGFICSGPYATDKAKHGFVALAVPEIRGKHLYRSYLIVNKNSVFRQLSDLRGGVFAFTDPESNTGKLVPTYWLALQDETPEQFFSKIIYTYSHDNSILAVANSLVDAATVHEQVWEYYNERNPVHTSQTRVIKRSTRFGNPLMVAAAAVPIPVRNQIREVLLSMHLDEDGKQILAELLIDRFVKPEEQWYQPIVAMKEKCAMP